MSRRTKEEKKLAEYRRRLKLLQPTEKTESFAESEKLTSGLEPKPKEKIVELAQDLKQQSYFRKDLKKSLVFILLIITLEIIIYSARIKI